MSGLFGIGGNGLFFAVMCLLMCVQMPVYCHYKVGQKGKAYTISKCAGSLIFLLTAVGSLIWHTPDVYSWLIIAAMILSFVGDYMLAQKAHHRLTVGGASFACAHICFVVAFICAAGFNWLAIPVIAVLFGAELLAARLMNLKNRGASASMAAYIISVTAMAVFAVFMLFAPEMRAEMSQTSKIMTAAGAVLFLASDFFWMTYGMIFSDAKPALKIANVLTYFPAQMLIAGALLFR